MRVIRIRLACSKNRRLLSDSRAHSDTSTGKSTPLCPNPGLIRTPRPANRRLLSESGAHSDSSTSKSTPLVRFPGSFGHLAQEIDTSCPNPGLIRTAHSKNRRLLSDSRAHSDTSLKKSTPLVRFRSSFGQLTQNRRLLSESRAHSDTSTGKSTPLCPNPGLIRTPRPANRRLLSDSGAHSDSSTSKSTPLVRIPGSFGHLAQEIDTSCPNPGLIRTAHSKNRRLLSDSGAHSDTSTGKSTALCPNPGLIRTPRSKNPRLLSDSGAHSDTSLKKSTPLVRFRSSFGHLDQQIDASVSESRAHSGTSLKKSPPLVRIRGSFGQLTQKIDASCPIPELIRTPRSKNPRLLSESGAHSDSSLKKSVPLVRIQGSFGHLAQKIPASLSESGAHSDSSLKKSTPLVRFRSSFEHLDQHCVRIQGSFGHLAQKIDTSCPNPGLIRTPRSRNRHLLSESTGQAPLKIPNSMRNAAPFGSFWKAVIVPLCPSTIAFVIARPMPEPPSAPL